MNDTFVINEIGSEFWDVPTSTIQQWVFPGNIRWFVSGTSALYYILEDVKKKKKITTAAVPSWCCSSMIEPFIRNGIEVCFYSVYINKDGLLACDYDSTPECDITLAITYFGYSFQTSVGEPGGIVIRDITHSAFCEKEYDGDYYFGSLRKWAGFWTGGYAWKNGDWNSDDEIPEADNKYLDLRRTAMNDKLAYLQGRVSNKEYLNLFGQGEDYLDHCAIMAGCKRDTEVAKYLDISSLKHRRRDNAKVLIAELNHAALFPSLGENDCPLFVPILLESDVRSELRNYLTGQGIYCPIHWGLTELHKLTDKEKWIYDHELSIVCDQRYCKDDMYRIVNAIRSFFHNSMVNV